MANNPKIAKWSPRKILKMRNAALSVSLSRAVGDRQSNRVQQFRTCL